MKKENIDIAAAICYNEEKAKNSEETTVRIVSLMEDTPGASGCLYEHGLCFCVETRGRKLLVDTGATAGFAANAEKLGVDLSDVDTVVISHGHYDHAGGVMTVAALVPRAKIYIRKNADGPFYNRRDGQTKYIGMDPAIAGLPQVTWVTEDCRLGEGLYLFGGVTGRRLWPGGNTVLQRKTADGFVQDAFDHEQYLLVCEGEMRVLLSGCAHNGILNILDACRDRIGLPTHVISGFHTTRPAYTPADDALVRETAEELAATGIRFWTGHCTGEHPMEILREILGDRLTVLHSGDEISLG